MWKAIFIILAVILFICAWVGLFSPKVFEDKRNPEKSMSRWQLFGVYMFLFVVLAGVSTLFGGKDQKEVSEVVSSTTKASDAKPIQYAVLEDEKLGRIKRSVELLLPERIEAVDLERLAHEIRDGDQTKYERTFIGWRVVGDDLEGMYWASTHFDPDLDVKIIGPTATEYAYLLALNPVVPGVELGRWIETGMGRYSHLLVGYQTGGKTYFHMYMLDGDDKATEYVEERVADEVRYRLGADSRDYMVINDEGGLVFGDEEGVVRVLGSELIRSLI